MYEHILTILMDVTNECPQHKRTGVTIRSGKHFTQWGRALSQCAQGGVGTRVLNQFQNSAIEWRDCVNRMDTSPLKNSLKHNFRSLVQF